MSLKKNLLYNIVLSVSNIIYPIITFPYASRILGPVGIGSVNFAQSYCQYFIYFAALGIPIYGIREIAKRRNDKMATSKLFWELIMIRLICSLASLVPYLIIVFAVGRFHENLPLYFWGIFLILFNVASIEWFFSGLEDFKYITYRSILVKIVSFLALYVLVRKRSDILEYFLINLGVVLLTGLVNVKYARKHLLFKEVAFSKLAFRSHVKPLLLIFGGVVAINVYAILDTVFLGIFSTDKAVGLYSTSTKISKLGLTVITALGTILVPRLSLAISQRNTTEIHKLLSQSFNFVVTLGVPASMALYIMAKDITLLYAGQEFQGAITSLKIMSPLIVIIGLANIYSVQILMPLAKDKQVLYAAIFGAGLSILLNIILIPMLKENGAAITYVVAELLVMFAVYQYARRSLTFTFKYSQLFKAILLSLIFIPVYMLAKLLFMEKYLYVIMFTSILSFSFYCLLQFSFWKNEIIFELIKSMQHIYVKIKLGFFKTPLH